MVKDVSGHLIFACGRIVLLMYLQLLVIEKYLLTDSTRHLEFKVCSKCLKFPSITY